MKRRSADDDALPRDQHDDIEIDLNNLTETCSSLSNDADAPLKGRKSNAQRESKKKKRRKSVERIRAPEVSLREDERGSATVNSLATSRQPVAPLSNIAEDDDLQCSGPVRPKRSVKNSRIIQTPSDSGATDSREPSITGSRNSSIVPSSPLRYPAMPPDKQVEKDINSTQLGKADAKVKTPRKVAPEVRIAEVEVAHVGQLIVPMRHSRARVPTIKKQLLEEQEELKKTKKTKKTKGAKGSPQRT